MNEQTWKRIEQLITAAIVAGVMTYYEHKSDSNVDKQIWSHVAQKEKEIQYVEKVEKINPPSNLPTANTNTVK